MGTEKGKQQPTTPDHLNKLVESLQNSAEIIYNKNKNEINKRLGIQSLDGITADMKSRIETQLLKKKKGGKKPYPTRRKKKRKGKTKKKKARGGTGTGTGSEIGYDEINLFFLIILALINLAMFPQLFQEPTWDHNDE